MRRLLQLIPTKPKPTKLTGQVVKTWGISDNNAYTALGVLRELGLIDQVGTPSEFYVGFMGQNSGAVLAQKTRERYATLFEQHENPQNASNEDLKRFFNINSGGSESTIDSQIRTFKVVGEFCRFDAPISAIASTSSTIGSSGSTGAASLGQGTSIHFDLHIHMPETKSAAESEAIIRAISDHIVQKMRN